MPKPWSKLEIDFIDHPKFQALSANAIALWLEGKNYCDKHATDGLIPAHALKMFRFSGRKSIQMLMTSAGLKDASGATYQPLWVDHPVGFKMVGYLEYNPCREEVLARRADAEDAAEIRKLANKERQAKFRQERKAKLERARNADRNALRNAPVTPVTPTPTVPVTTTATDKKKELPAERKEPSAVTRFLGLYEELFERAHGKKPLIVRPRDPGIAKQLIVKAGEEDARSLLRAFFESEDSFIVDTAGHGLNIFISQINKLLSSHKVKKTNGVTAESAAEYLERIGWCSHDPKCLDSEVCRAKRAQEKAAAV